MIYGYALNDKLVLRLQNLVLQKLFYAEEFFVTLDFGYRAITS